ncbi:urease accessory protein UreD [uncultured Nocardioides sp.]|uniref:urease accessory protein UreD n=1 Tax=uncultured Nocardioides sp. TaxID=198441 RepID=UPI0026277F32|nr:urease accessory protein UreD [uncultured Nocardioides sp.]
MRTRIDLRVDPGADGGRPRVDLGHGLLQARRVRTAATGTVEVALLAGQALLLAGDEVAVDVRVEGPVHLVVTEPAGTVTYDMRADPAGRGARWDVTVTACRGARVTWRGEPFVVADGAAVDRATTVAVDEDSVVALRETVVLGRSGEVGGALRTTTRLTRAGRPVLAEDLDLSPGVRDGVAVLAGHRCLDSLTVVGERLPDGPDVLQLDALGSVRRWLGARAHLSPLAAT